MKTLHRPAQRYVCSAIDCRNGYAGAPAAETFAEGFQTLEQQTAKLQKDGWRIGWGTSSCPRCAVVEAARNAQQEQASITRLPTQTQLERQLRASLRADHNRDTQGGTAAVIAGRFGR